MNYLFVFIGLAIFAWFDYWAFNLIAKHWGYVRTYRIIEASVQAVLAYGLFRAFNPDTNLWAAVRTFFTNPILLREPLVFLWLWWTWNADLLYYVYAQITDGFNIEWLEHQGGFDDIREDRVTWAWWTPMGLIRGFNEEVRLTPIPGRDLYVQAAAGALSSAIILFF
jgi:hypothetical protein